MGIGLVTIVVYNPIAYNVFDIVRGGEIVNHRYRNKKGWQRALQTLGDLGLSMLVVILVYLSYQNINLFLVGLLGCPQKRWWWLANPSDFATLYTQFYSAITGLTDELRAIRTGSAAVCK